MKKSKFSVLGALRFSKNQYFLDVKRFALHTLNISWHKNIGSFNWIGAGHDHLGAIWHWSLHLGTQFIILPLIHSKIANMNLDVMESVGTAINSADYDKSIRET